VIRSVTRSSPEATARLQAALIVKGTDQPSSLRAGRPVPFAQALTKRHFRRRGNKMELENERQVSKVPQAAAEAAQ
jgi:hypothetical protein